jgi:hypothetical protein
MTYVQVRATFSLCYVALVILCLCHAVVGQQQRTNAGCQWRVNASRVFTRIAGLPRVRIELEKGCFTGLSVS